MGNPVIILHGWSDDYKSFIPLGQWLTTQGFKVIDIFLGNYMSMNDELTIYDLALGFKNALAEEGVSQKPHSFDVIVHSTGGLVIREYLRQVCQGDPKATPVERLLMMSPANFGSPLAAQGKSVLGRFIKGWKWDGLWQTGTLILNALELASPYSWELAEADLFDPKFTIYAPENVMVTVFAGTAAYDNPFRRALHENGSDGTVRASTANLNAHLFRLSFEDPKKPNLVAVPRSCPDTAYAVFDRDHTAIHDPEDPRQADAWAKLVIEALSVQTADYGNHVRECMKVTALTFAPAPTPKNPDWYHQYQHVVFRVKDQFGEPITDYVVEFYQKDDKKDGVLEEIHSEILEKVTKHSVDNSYRSFLFDTTDLGAFLTAEEAEVDMSISVAALSERISFQNPDGGIRVFSATDEALVFPNEPVLVDVVINRVPSEEVFAIVPLAKAK